MTGEELKKKLDAVGISYAEVARKLGVFPQSFNKTLKANDVGSGTLEKISKILGKDMSFFYGDVSTFTSDDEVERLREENAVLKAELSRKNDVHMPTRDSKVYNLWMKFMQITMEMQELYKEEKGTSGI